MVSSTQLTDLANRSGNPAEFEFNLWRKTRYLMAQEPAAKDFTDTVPGHYKGRTVIPGPLANEKLAGLLGFPTLTISDYQIMRNRFHIRFIDNRTTDGADDSIRKANYTIMSKAEADDYEAELKAYYDKHKRVPS